MPVKGSVFEDNIFGSPLPGWNNIESQKDIDFLLHETSSFHDSAIKNLAYESGGAYVDNNRCIQPAANLRRVCVVIEIQCCKPFEMMFEGVVEIHVRPPRDNYMADIYSASILLENEVIFFIDDNLQNIDILYAGTWLSAYSLRWRFI